MREVTYESIEPLLQGVKRVGDRLRCTFRCPVTGASHKASASLKDDPQGARLGLLSSVSAALGRALRGALGASDDAEEEAADAAAVETAPDPGPEERKAIVVRAFEALSPGFVWDGRKGAWVSADAVGDLSPRFAQQLAAHPVKRVEDREVLARILTGIARADGHVEPDEWAFLAEFVLADIGSPDDFMEMPALTPAELERVSAGGVRETMAMLAWAMAMTDQELAETEATLVEAFAQGLGLTPERTAAAREHAQRYVVDQALGALHAERGDLDAEAIERAREVARAVRLDPAAVDDVAARYRMRNGL